MVHAENSAGRALEFSGDAEPREMAARSRFTADGQKPAYGCPRADFLEVRDQKSGVRSQESGIRNQELTD